MASCPFEDPDCQPIQSLGNTAIGQIVMRRKSTALAKFSSCEVFDIFVLVKIFSDPAKIVNETRRFPGEIGAKGHGFKAVKIFAMKQ